MTPLATTLRNDDAVAEAGAVLGLLLTPGLGRASAWRVVDAAARTGTSVAALVKASHAYRIRLLSAVSPEALGVLARLDARAAAEGERLVHRTIETGCSVLVCNLPDYPAALRACLRTSAPPVLFTRGNTGLLETPQGAVVGARAASAKGLALAGSAAAALAESGVALVSGGAPGVDTAAHSASLEAGGTTVMVLPQGILTRAMPPWLEEGLEQGRALVVSEHAPDAAWQRHAAVTRNATIAAFAEMICVIEPRKRGGSIRTAQCGIEQGKRVLVHGVASKALRRDLAAMGVLDLVEEGGSFDPGRLRALWETRPAPSPRQGVLL